MRTYVLCILTIVLASCGAVQTAQQKSLTDESYAGQKYYLGWGVAYYKDPQLMHNEVKFDVLHTHDIFTAQLGGNYLGTKDIGTNVTGDMVRARWNELRTKMKSDDMYVQYSSGHGLKTGLMIGISWTEMRDAILSMPSKETIVFTMACYSGGLVKALDQVKSQWRDRDAQGRTLFVMSSSTDRQTSSTGPNTDPDEKNGPSGSAGSAYGHSLWKALIGYADGWLDGVRDGYTSLEEIEQFVKWKTANVGGHNPLVTGVYNPGLIMNRVPTKAFIDSLGVTSEGLSDAELEAQIRALDAAMRLEQ